VRRFATTLSISNMKDIHGVNRAGEHLFPFRTEQLSPAPPMVLGSNPGE
jgi:hypothetical protein